MFNQVEKIAAGAGKTTVQKLSSASQTTPVTSSKTFLFAANTAVDKFQSSASGAIQSRGKTAAVGIFGSLGAFGAVAVGYLRSVSEKVREMRNSEYLGDKLYETTGIMTTDTVRRKAEKLGESLVELQSKNPSVSKSEILSVIESSLGKKEFSKMRTIRSKEHFVEIAQKNAGVSKQEALSVYLQSLGAVILKGKGDDIYFHLRPEIPNQNKLVSQVVTHEFSHYLYNRYSLAAKLIDVGFLDKLSVDEYREFANKGFSYQTDLQKSFPFLSTRTLETSADLLDVTGCTSREELYSIIRKITNKNQIFQPGYDTKSLCKAIADLTVFISYLSDEAAAYKVGFHSQKMYDKNISRKTNGSSVLANSANNVSLLYTEVVKVLEQERVNCMKQLLKSICGIKGPSEHFAEGIKNLLSNNDVKTVSAEELGSSPSIIEQIVYSDRGKNFAG